MLAGGANGFGAPELGSALGTNGFEFGATLVPVAFGTKGALAGATCFDITLDPLPKMLPDARCDDAYAR